MKQDTVKTSKTGYLTCVGLERNPVRLGKLISSSEWSCLLDHFNPAKLGKSLWDLRKTRAKHLGFSSLPEANKINEKESAHLDGLAVSIDVEAAANTSPSTRTLSKGRPNKRSVQAGVEMMMIIKKERKKRKRKKREQERRQVPPPPVPNRIDENASSSSSSLSVQSNYTATPFFPLMTSSLTNRDRRSSPLVP